MGPTTVSLAGTPPLVLEPRREVLVVSVGEAQWEGFQDRTAHILTRTYDKAMAHIAHIGWCWPGPLEMIASLPLKVLRIYQLWCEMTLDGIHSLL